MSDFFTRLALRTIDVSSPTHSDTRSNALAPTAAIPESPVVDIEDGSGVAPEAEPREEHIARTGDVPPVFSASAPATYQPPTPSAGPAPATPAAIEPAGGETPEPLHGEERVERESMTQPVSRSESIPLPDNRRESAPRPASSLPEMEAPAPSRPSIDTGGVPAPAAPADQSPHAAQAPAPPASIEPATASDIIPSLPGTLAPMSDRTQQMFGDAGIDNAPAPPLGGGDVIEQREHGSSAREEIGGPLHTIAPAIPSPAMPHETDDPVTPAPEPARAMESARGSDPIHPSQPAHVEPLDTLEPVSPAPRARSFFRDLFSSRREGRAPERGGDAAESSESRSSDGEPAARNAPDQRSAPIAPSEIFGTIRPFASGVEPLDVSINDDGASSEPAWDRAARQAASEPSRTTGEPSRQQESGSSDSTTSSTDLSQNARRDRSSRAQGPTPAPRGEERSVEPAKRADEGSQTSRSKGVDAAERAQAQRSVRPGSQAALDLPPSEGASAAPRREAMREEARSTSVSPSSPSSEQGRPAAARIRSMQAGIAREIVKPLKAEAERIEGRIAEESAAQARAEKGREMARPATEHVMPERADVRPMSSHVAAAPAESTPAGRRESAPPPPAIRVSIGRVEVRAEAPPSAPPPRAGARPRGPAISLSDYLKQRNRGH